MAELPPEAIERLCSTWAAILSERLGQRVRVHIATSPESGELERADDRVLGFVDATER